MKITKIPKLKRKLKLGDEVSYNVVDKDSAYNVTGDVVRVHKDGDVDVDTGGRIDRRVHPTMIALGEKYPIGVIHIQQNEKKFGRKKMKKL